MHDESLDAGAPLQSAAESLGAKLLLVALSLIAGSTDVISFAGLDGLFTAHVTGNLVILAARLFAGSHAPIAHLISVPVFVAVLVATRLLAGGLERVRIDPIRPLLLLQFLLLAAFLAACIAAGSRADPNAINMIVAGMLGVSTMAVQNALVQISLKGAPATAVMTTNLTRLVMDLGDVLRGRSAADRTKAGERVRRTGLTIAGFVVGCGLGAWCEAIVGLRSLVLPAGLALVALAIALTVKLDGAPSSTPRPRARSYI